MKKLIIYLAIMCVALAGVLGIHLAITHSSSTLLDGKGEDCPIVETVLAGDPARLEGWQIDFSLYAGDHLQWDGTYHLGAVGSCTTSDSFNIPPLPSRDLTHASLGIYYDISDTFESTSKFSAYGYGPVLKYANAHIKSTDGTMTLALADILKHYPLSLSVFYSSDEVGYYAPDLFNSRSGILNAYTENTDEYIALQELFRFPVQPEDSALVTIDGRSKSIHFTLQVQRSSYVTNYSFVTDEGIYLLPVYRSTDGRFLKTEHAQGVGVYFLPFKEDGCVTLNNKAVTAVVADARNAVNVCPLGEDAQVCLARFSEDASTITLVLLEEDQYIAQVMDLSNGAILQRTSITKALTVPAVDNTDLPSIRLSGSTLALRQKDTITVVDLSGSEDTMTIDVSDFAPMAEHDYIPGSIIVKDGQAVLVRPDGSLFEVMAWGKDGLLFHGKYTYAALYEPHGAPEPSLELRLTSVKPSKP